MKLELESEEARELLSALVDRLLNEAGLGDGDRAALRRWRSESMKAGSEEMKALTAKVNADIDRALRAKAKSVVQKPDWR